MPIRATEIANMFCSYLGVTRKNKDLKTLLPYTKICLVDGIPFSWYGDLIQHSPLYFKELHKKL